MNKQVTVQAVAFSLAALITASLLSSVSGVADQQYTQAVVAQATTTYTAPVQQVVIIGKRIPRA